MPRRAGRGPWESRSVSPRSSFARDRRSAFGGRGAALATLAVGGAILTLGLVRRWGEVFPGWIPFLGGGRVPIWFAVVPASLVSVLVTAAGLMFVRLTLTGGLGAILGEGVLGGQNWAALAPELLWPLWGVALGAATLAYYYRRRGKCKHCGRG